MTLKQLQYLVAVAEHRHFSRAAEACYVTQSTLSLQMKQLEDYLGVPLLDRDQKPITPTLVGQHIISLARVALTATDKIKTTARQNQCLNQTNFQRESRSAIDNINGKQHGFPLE